MIGLPLLALLQTTEMTEAGFRAVLIRVIVVGLLSMGSAFVLLLFFWRNLAKESEAEEHRTRSSTIVLLAALIVILLVMSLVIYRFGGP